MCTALLPYCGPLRLRLPCVAGRVTMGVIPGTLFRFHTLTTRTRFSRTCHDAALLRLGTFSKVLGIAWSFGYSCMRKKPVYMCMAVSMAVLCTAVSGHGETERGYLYLGLGAVLLLAHMAHAHLLITLFGLAAASSAQTSVSSHTSTKAGCSCTLYCTAARGARRPPRAEPPRARARTCRCMPRRAKMPPGAPGMPPGCRRALSLTGEWLPRR